MSDSSPSPNHAEASAGVRSGVLARKYRPENFQGIIGQTATVRMLQNALEQDRVAQALVFSGVRGTGKTTLARIVAKGLNCLSSDAPTAEPCGKCQSCTEIAAGNSLDVQEIDAASHTGVDHIRELIGSVSYRASGRYKVYILDEVHMLSTSAFNALLKTLEEPPAHVRFIFATTEIRKIPPTVLSRTQRFALRRVQAAELAEFLAKVVKSEAGEAESQALSLIARAAEGSVRDGLSMLDQFLSGSNNALNATYVRDQLGQASSGAVLNLMQALLVKDGVEMLRIIDSERNLGTDPLSIVRDLLAICHQISRHKVIKEAPDSDYADSDQQAHQQIAAKVPMGQLARLWQVLLKGAGELKTAPDPMMALEMLMIRAHYLADVPTPQQILSAQPPAEPQPMLQQQVTPKAKPVPVAPKIEVEPEPQAAPIVAPEPPPFEQESENPAPVEESENPEPTSETVPMIIDDFATCVSALEENGESYLASVLRQEARLVEFAVGKLVVYLPKEQHQRMQNLDRLLSNISNQTWKVQLLDVPTDEAEMTLADQEKIKKQKLYEEISQDGLMQEVANLFPGSQLTRLADKEK